MAAECALILPLCVQVLLFCHSVKMLNTMEQLVLRVVYHYVRLDGASAPMTILKPAQCVLGLLVCCSRRYQILGWPARRCCCSATA